jgi:hypothetical protein
MRDQRQWRRWTAAADIGGTVVAAAERGRHECAQGDGRRGASDRRRQGCHAPVGRVAVGGTNGAAAMATHHHRLR